MKFVSAVQYFRAWRDRGDVLAVVVLLEISDQSTLVVVAIAIRTRPVEGRMKVTIEWPSREIALEARVRRRSCLVVPELIVLGVKDTVFLWYQLLSRFIENRSRRMLHTITLWIM